MEATTLVQLMPKYAFVSALNQKINNGMQNTSVQTLVNPMQIGKNP